MVTNTDLASAARTPALNWSDIGGRVSLSIRKTSGVGATPAAMKPSSAALLKYSGFHAIVGLPLGSGRPSAEKRKVRAAHCSRNLSSPAL